MSRSKHPRTPNGNKDTGPIIPGSPVHRLMKLIGEVVAKRLKEKGNISPQTKNAIDEHQTIHDKGSGDAT